MRRLPLLPLAAAVGSTLLLAVACGGGESTGAADPAAQSGSATTPTETGTATGETAAAAEGVDPRKGGFEIALGEWALTPEAESIRPGRATFVITNRGTMPHGFEIEREGSDDDRDKLETRVLQPGETVKVDLNLSEGVYKLECNVEGHDDMGMEMLFEVKKGAPLVKATGRKTSQAGKELAVDVRRLRLPARDARSGRRSEDHLDEPRPRRAHRHAGGRRLRLGHHGRERELQSSVRPAG
jgi:uncharacterized cupredoxin-like copper-binding protein